MALTVHNEGRPDAPEAYVLAGPVRDIYAVLVAARRDLNAMASAPGLSSEGKQRYSVQAHMVTRAMETVPAEVRDAFHAGSASPEKPVARVAVIAETPSVEDLF
jgi:hypothetical protein